MIKDQLTYEQLRDFGLDYIRKISSGRWTDFNAHDPGVTALEALALAVSDLSYRSSFQMADLLTRKGAKGPAMEGTMFPACDILAQEPTTLDDYRKLILENVPGVRNVWLETAQRRVRIVDNRGRRYERNIDVGGYYNVFVELESEESFLDDPFIKTVVGGMGSDADPEIWRLNYKHYFSEYIRKLLLLHRNIGENVKDINILSTVEVGITAEVEIESDIDVRPVLQKIYDVLYDYVCPTIPFHTIEGLLAKGRKPEDIFGAGAPLLGFIDREELARFDRKTELNTSDVIGLMMKIDGIVSVRHMRFVMHTGKGDVMGTHIKLDDRNRSSFTLCPRFIRSGEKHGKTFMNNVVFMKRKLSFFPPAGDNGVYVATREDERKRLPGVFATDVPPTAGQYRDTDRYFSFQNLFPKAYRLGLDSIADNASKLRRAQWLQLKAYLSFFDQLLSDYLSHIDSFLDLLSVEPSDAQDCGDVYFHRRVLDSDVNSISAVLSGYPNYAIPPEDTDSSIRRKNQVMNHLLSRFSDSFAEFTALSFLKSGGANFSLRETVEDKKRFLKDYAFISSHRSSGINFSFGAQITGAEQRILRKIGVNDPENRQWLAGGDLFGLHIIEHGLLAPYNTNGVFLELAREEGRSELIADPYTFHVTVAVPGWTDLSLNLPFRMHVERVIREELPAHLCVKVCWLSKRAMEALESALMGLYNFTRNNYFPDQYNWRVGYDYNAGIVAAVMGSLYNVYPEAVTAPEEAFDFDDNLPMYDFTHLGSPDGEEPDEIRPEDLPFYLWGESGIKELDKFHWIDPVPEPPEPPEPPKPQPVPTPPVPAPPVAPPSSEKPALVVISSGARIARLRVMRRAKTGRKMKPLVIETEIRLSFPGLDLLIDTVKDGPARPGEPPKPATADTAPIISDRESAPPVIKRKAAGTRKRTKTK